jgi:nucleoside-diphosphate-sugar epimerase
MKNTRILVTGANGFVGRHLCRTLAAEGHTMTGFVRPGGDVSGMEAIRSLTLVTQVNYGDVGSYARLLGDIDVVVHLAARVHILNDTAPWPLAECRKVNVDITRSLATAAAAAGVRRFVYVSSIKVNGETTESRPFAPDDPPAFVDPYGQSKWEAEEAIHESCAHSGMEWTVVRPPLVYGPGVRGNFLSLLRAVKRGLPLPLGGISNCRSLVSVFNLVDLLKTMLYHPRAAGQRFLVKDPEDVSTAELVRHVALGLHRSARLVPIPANVLAAFGRICGYDEVITRLCASLVVNIEKTRNDLGWVAPMSLVEGIRNTCEWFNTATSDGVPWATR